MPSRRLCVVKQLKPLHKEPQVYEIIRDRFAREAVILEELGTTNRQIPQLYAYFESDNKFYLVQEYIEGNTLTKIVQNQGKLDESSVKEILVKLLEVLEYVHQHHILHRDIKPDNIIISKSDNLPVLIDFGAVKETMSTILSSSGTPSSSIVIGTPGFMPSEQSIGRPVYATDLYALSLTVIYLLTGKTPQELDNDPLSGEIIWQEHAPQTSKDLAVVLNKGIKSHHRDRFPTAESMLAALLGKANHTENLTTELLPKTVAINQKSQEIITSSNQGVRYILIATTLGVFLIIGIVYLIWQQQETFKKKIADLEERNNSPSPTVNPTPLLSPEAETPSQPSAIPSVNTTYLDVKQATEIIEQLYQALSSKNYAEAVNLFSPELSSQFNHSFFDQFQSVTVENLRVTSRTDSMIELIGENTYYYFDGSTQRELRAYTVNNLNGQILITDSHFIKVIKFRAR